MFSEKVWEGLLRTMNSHIPSQRPSLSDLLDQDEPSYLGKDGRTYQIERSELIFLAKNTDKWDWSRLKIPILLMTDTNYEKGCWKVIGKLETKVISRIIGREAEKEDEILIFYPQMQELRRLLPTTTNSMYMP
jgi:hypothetical protein